MSGDKYFILKALLAAIFLNGMCGSFIHAQKIRIPTDLETVRPIFRQDTLEICFMGDMMMHAKQLETALRKDGSYDFSSYFSFVEDRIKDADISVANMEYTLAGEP